LLNKQVNPTLLARPAVEDGRSGWDLPGTRNEDRSSTCGPLYDALYDMWTLTSWRFPGKGIIEVARWRSCAAARK